MDEGLFFWMIILAVAVLQGIGQRKKKPGQPGQKPPGQPKPRSPGQKIPGGTGVAAGPPGGPREAESSADMIPADVWADILGLARGEPKATVEKPVAAEEEETEAWAAGEQASEIREERPRGDPPNSSVTRREDVPAPQARVFPASHGANAVLHQTSSGDVQSRLGVSRSAISRSDGEDVPKPAAAVRSGLFGTGSTAELRKAVILSEVLGPPVGLRE